jgi:lipopolysaccharide/colanic/teichoic acid biosynthesis glycosyltransferase
MIRLARWFAVAGPVVVVLGLSKYHAAVLAVPAYDFTSTFRMPWACAFIALLWIAAYGVGLPDARDRRRSVLLASGVAVTLAATGISLLQLATADAVLPRFVVIGSAAILIPWYLLSARIADDARARARVSTRIVVVGETDEVASLWADLAGPTLRQASIAASLQPTEAAVRVDNAPLVDLATSVDGNLVVLDQAAQAQPSVLRQAAALHGRGVRVRTMLAFYEEWLGKLPITELERISMLFDIAEIHGGPYARIKRLMDVACGAAAAVCLALALPLVVVGNLVANRGPVFFRQERIGKGGRQFTIWKLRTMRPEPDGFVPGEWTREDDPRVTRFGRLLRRTHIDELPQAWNILRGDLSVVGPRPEQPRYVEELTSKLPFYPLRHLVRPGLTGWAQVMYGYAGDEQDALEKLQYEFFYLRRQSLTLDLRILARTVRSISGGKGSGR